MSINLWIHFKEVKMEDQIILTDEERQPCEVWTRVMGYFRPYNNFNKGKKSEFDERKWFEESNTRACPCEKMSA